MPLTEAESRQSILKFDKKFQDIFKKYAYFVETISRKTSENVIETEKRQGNLGKITRITENTLRSGKDTQLFTKSIITTNENRIS